MEYKLNKIDIEFRERINDATSEGKVHSKQGISIGKDKKQKDDGQNFKSELSKYSKNKKKLIVNASKSSMVEVDAFKEELTEKDRTDLAGSVLDVRK